MQVITLDQVKTYLGIANTTNDAAIAAIIPVIDAKVKLITGQRFNKLLRGNITAGSDIMEIFSTDAPYSYRLEAGTVADMMLSKDMPTGTVITGTGIPEDTYIAESYYDGVVGIEITDTHSAPFVQLSADATVTAVGAQFYAGVNIAYLPTIAKGAWWLLREQSTTIDDTAWASRSIGPMSITRGAGSERINNKYGMPAWFVASLPRYHR